MVNELQKRLLVLIVVRLLLVTLVLGVAILAIPSQPHFFQFFQPFILVMLVVSVGYMLAWKTLQRPTLLYYVQFSLDLLLVSGLVFVSGGINSIYSPLYVLIIVYASLLRAREDVIVAVTLSITLYTGIVHLNYLGLIPGVEDFGPYPMVIYRISLNTLGFMAVALLGIFLSERIRSAHRELGRTKALHQIVLDSIRDGILTIDTDGRITSFNLAAEQITGHLSESVLSRDLTTVFPDSILHRIRSTDFDAEPGALRLNSWIADRQGQMLYLSMSCSPLLSPRKKSVGWVVSFQDHTELHRREEEVRLSEKMAAIGHVAADLAHEIRNPLGSLSGSIQVLKSELHLSDKRSRLVDIVLRECDRLNKIVGDFLEYAGPKPRGMEAIDLLELVRDTVALFRNSGDLLRSHVIDIIPKSDPLYCRANADQLRQVVWNILQNGVRAMPEGGKMSIELQGDEDRARMTFSDEGIGISDGDKKRLFQPFHTGFKKGSGLGLSIVYQIVKQHRGKIDIQDVEPQGTAITITLPV